MNKLFNHLKAEHYLNKIEIGCFGIIVKNDKSSIDSLNSGYHNTYNINSEVSSDKEKNNSIGSNSSIDSIYDYGVEIVKKYEVLRGDKNFEYDLYNSILRHEDLNNYKKLMNLEYLGLPYLIDSCIKEIAIDDTIIRYTCITMPYYGENLKGILPLNLKNALTIFRVILPALEYLHFHGYTHNDIKPANIIVPRGQSGNQDFNRSVLIDFGLGSSSRQLESFVGTKLFASINAHRCGKLMPMDDIQSLCFNLLYWLYKKLPWSSSTKLYIHKQQFKRNYKKTLVNYPENIVNIFEYMFSLTKYDKIKYKYLQSLSV